MSTTEDSSSAGEDRRPARPVYGYALIALVVAAVLAGIAAVAVAVAATSHIRRGPDLGPFAGDVMSGHALHSVSAAWTVPRLRGESPPGVASAWIGAQAPGPDGDAPFIQVGTIDQRAVSGTDAYIAFWTDTDRHFLPVRLLDVRPGDRMQASLRLVDGEWHVELRDRTAGVTRTVLTGQEATAVFNDVQWLQEDPGRPGPAGIDERRAPYAPVSTVRFRDLRADGRAVAPGRPLTQWMSLPGADLAPTPIVDDAFSIVPRRLGAPARRYLRIVAPEDGAQQRFVVTLVPWLHSGPDARIAPATDRLVKAIGDLDTGLSRSGWPASSAAARVTLRSRGSALVAVTRRAPAVPRPARASFNREWMRAAAAFGEAARVVRRDLGAPEYTPFIR